LSAQATSERDRQTQDDPAEADDRRRRLLARLDAAEREAGTAEGASEEANSLLDDAAVRRASLLRDREDLARRLEELDAELTDAARELARRQREADRAQRSLDAAHEETERLRAALDE
jgi:chromosome segregation ATPase